MPMVVIPGIRKTIIIESYLCELRKSGYWYVLGHRMTMIKFFSMIFCMPSLNTIRQNMKL